VGSNNSNKAVMEGEGEEGEEEVGDGEWALDAVVEEVVIEELEKVVDYLVYGKN
jgi:hypothetical protein